MSDINNESDGEFSQLAQENDDEIMRLAEEARSDILPQKSKKVYNRIYDNYLKWRNPKKNSTDEDTLLAYFQVLSKKYAPSTLWSIYSMLKSIIDLKENIKIHNYKQVTSFIKRKNDGYKPKQSKTLTGKNVQDFLENAPDDEYLAIKVIIIFGINGACRTSETTDMTINNIEKQGDIFLVKIPKTKNKCARSYAISKEFTPFIQKYMDLRPETRKDRFFLRYSHGRCYDQVIGINKVSEAPKIIANFLKLPDADLYTGHCFRRTAATLSAEGGLDSISMCTLAGWKNIQTAKRYVDNTETMKKKTANLISKAINMPSTSGAYMPCTSGVNVSSTSGVTTTASDRVLKAINNNVNVPSNSGEIKKQKSSTKNNNPAFIEETFMTQEEIDELFNTSFPSKIKTLENIDNPETNFTQEEVNELFHTDFQGAIKNFQPHNKTERESLSSTLSLAMEKCKSDINVFHTNQAYESTANSYILLEINEELSMMNGNQFLNYNIIEDTANILECFKKDYFNQYIIVMNTPELTGFIDVNQTGTLKVYRPWTILNDKQNIIHITHYNTIKKNKLKVKNVLNRSILVENNVIYENNCSCIQEKKISNQCKSKIQENLIENIFSKIFDS